MCMNCGCGQPNEAHDKPDNVTLDDLRAAARANDQSLRESAQHILETVQLVSSEDTTDRGLAQPAGPDGASTAGSKAGRGTPASES